MSVMSLQRDNFDLRPSQSYIKESRQKSEGDTVNTECFAVKKRLALVQYSLLFMRKY